MALTYSGKLNFTNGHWTKNPMLLTITTNNLMVSSVRRPNFSIVIKDIVLTSVSGSITLNIPELAGIPDDDGKYSFDLAPLLDSAIEDITQNSDFTLRFERLGVTSFGDFNLSITAVERYGNPPVDNAATETTLTKRIHWGANHNLDESDQWTLVSLIEGYVDTTPLLTNMPQYAPLRLNQPQFLTYYHNKVGEGTQEVALQFKVILHDGTEGLWNPTEIPDSITLQELQRGTFRFSPASVGVQPEARILSARVILVSTEAPLSDWMNYTIMRDEKATDLTLIYINAYGVLESIYANGRHASSLQLQRNTVVREITADKQALFAGRKQRSISKEAPKVMRSGYISSSELEQWQEALTSNHTYLVDRSYTIEAETVLSYTAITFLTDKFRITEVSQYLHSFEAEYMESFPITHFGKHTQPIDEEGRIQAFADELPVDTNTYVYLN